MAHPASKEGKQQNSTSDNQCLIYVQVPAYRDPQLVPTLDSLLSQAAHPERLRVRVCWQRGARDRVPAYLRSCVEFDEVDYRQSRGANWARRRVQKAWDGEPYTLIIDSHLRFARNWDSRCLRWLHDLKAAGVPSPVLTCYPPNFDPGTYPKGRSRVPLKNYKEGYIDGLLLHFAGFPLPLWTWLKAPIPAQFLALGFLFAEGRFNAEVPIDPHIYFFGDEITTGLRAYCHGYDFFHPHRVVAWHAYDRDSRRCHWEDHDIWHHLDSLSLARARKVLQGREFPGYLLGSRRTVSDYEKFIGMPLLIGS